MDPWREALWQQFGAAIDTLGNAIRACPDELWDDGRVAPELFWYSAYHCIFFLDYYLSASPDDFEPPSPFGLSELDPEGRLPDRVYTPDVLLDYLAHGRRKCRQTIAALTDDDAGEPSPFGRGLSVLELYLYTLRHVQHHAAQLNLLLRQRAGIRSAWVNKATP